MRTCFSRTITQVLCGRKTAYNNLEPKNKSDVVISLVFTDHVLFYVASHVIIFGGSK